MFCYFERNGTPSLAIINDEKVLDKRNKRHFKIHPVNKAEDEKVKRCVQVIVWHSSTTLRKKKFSRRSVIECKSLRIVVRSLYEGISIIKHRNYIEKAQKSRTLDITTTIPMCLQSSTAECSSCLQLTSSIVLLLAFVYRPTIQCLGVLYFS